MHTLKKIEFTRIVSTIKEIVTNALLWEILDSVTECKFINALTSLFEEYNVSPLIVTGLNYETKFIDTYIEFPDGRFIKLYIDGSQSADKLVGDSEICIEVGR